MNNFQENIWKEELRSEIIHAIVGTPEEKRDSFLKMGNFYQNYAPPFLYKYYRSTPENISAIKNNKIWFSSPCNFNDVFDCDISVDEKDIFEWVLNNLNERKIKRNSTKWFQLKSKISQEIVTLQESLKLFKANMGITCLSELDNSLLMWAHYAENHRGICVEYNLLKMNSQSKLSAVPVIYSKNKVKFYPTESANINTESLRALIYSITSKSPEWDYEREWRIIQDSEACGKSWNCEAKGALLSIIKPNSIILGCKVDCTVERDMIEYCKSEKIPLYKMFKDEAYYCLNKKRIL